jgi:hypothetical protein
MTRLLLLTVIAAAAFSVAPGLAGAQQRYRPRIGGAWGITPKYGREVEIAIAENYPVVYHGGSVMSDVTIHAVFWAPSGFQFEGSPSPGVLSYEQLVQQWFTDVAHDSGTKTNIYSVLDEYGDGNGPGAYGISFNAAADTIDDTDPYPAGDEQCASPGGISTCVTDVEVQEELDNVITAHDPTGRGLHDLWFVFLPPNVDECTSDGVCGTSEYAGYHSLSNVGHGPVIYAVIPDPTIELTPSPGSDPEGNPIAESTLDTVAHETFEAMTNPEGNGWMDPNGFEAADKCENGPQQGTPLGFASDGSPYNQVINGHEYLVQMIWSDAANGCVQHSSATPPAPSLATVDETQFSRVVSGNIGNAKAGVSVRVGLVRVDTVVSVATARTRAGGGWSVRLSHAVGDDRDAVIVDYGSGGPGPDLIATGDGGNPFTQSGWTGWFDLDSGYAVGPGGVLIGPCSQTGVLSLQVGSVTTEPPAALCQTESDVAEMDTTKEITDRTPITFSSEDNRAVSSLNPAGALVKLTVHLGEPDSISALQNDEVLFDPTGFPSCTANLEAQTVRCDGLVPGERYTVERGRSRRDVRGDGNGEVHLALALRGGDQVALVNSAGRTLTTLHVAHLRAHVVGDDSALASGTCQPGDYYGAPVSRPPLGSQVGVGIAGSGPVCPLSGRARGLSASDIEQTDDFSGGLTRTVVPQLESFSPSSGATLYGPFIATAQPVLPGPGGSSYGVRASVSLSVSRAGSKHRVLFLRNAARGAGVRVAALSPGAYRATWVLTDANGDTRTVYSRFVEAG